MVYQMSHRFRLHRAADTHNFDKTAAVEERIAAVNKDLQAQFVRLAFIAGAVLLPFMFVREFAPSPPWLLANLAALGSAVLVYALRERAPQWALIASLSLFFYLLSSSALWVGGVSIPALFGYALMLAIVPAAWSVRAGVLAALLCAASYVSIGVLRVPDLKMNGGAASSELDAWLYAGTFFWGCISVVFVLIGRMKAHIHGLLHSESERSGELVRANADLVASNDRYTALNEQLEARVRARTAELEAANRGLVDDNVRLEAFNYMVSHDLRSPLQSIDGFSRLLARDLGGNVSPMVQRDLGRIQSGVERLQGMVVELLKLAQRSNTELQPQSVNMSAVAQEIVEELRMADPGRSVDVEIIPGLWVNADPILIREVLQNLLCNAWKFTAKKPHPRIELGVAEMSGDVVYFVEDNGAGFDPARMHELFQPFHRLHSADEFSGTGVGLAAAQRIIECHGGRIWAQGAPGQGARFLFSLPADLPMGGTARRSNGSGRSDASDCD